MRWYLQVMKQYGVFHGRAQRKEYWMFVLFNSIIAFAIGFASGFLEAVLGMGTAISDFTSIVYGLATFIPGVAVGVRRMHDIGRSGWWLLFPLVNLVFLCLDSQPGSNEYGSNPKAAEREVQASLERTVSTV